MKIIDKKIKKILYYEKNKEYIKEKARKYYYDHIEKCREDRKKWKIKNFEKYKIKYREASRKYYKKNRKLCNEKTRKWYNENKVEEHKHRKIKHEEKKEIVFNHYGNKCVCCGETIKEFFTIDHINNDGAEQKRKYKIYHFYRWIIRNDFPKDLQILCANCNYAKAIYGICPHQQEKK